MHNLPDLPYEYDALQPVIDAKTMQIHHDLHHGGYVKKLNAALDGHDDLMGMDIGELLKDLNQIPENIRTAVQNNGGGHFNHSLFWTIMKPGGQDPHGEVLDAITQGFGDFSKFQEEYENAALSLFGSGWAWLVKDSDGKISIMKTSNQDCPISQGYTPVMGLDVWEHAYYLQYQNKRADYVKAWFNILNWDEINKNYLK